MDGIIWKIDKKNKDKDIISASLNLTISTSIDKTFWIDENIKKRLKVLMEKRILDKVIELAVKEMEKSIKEGSWKFG